jgi:hypothetical protein
MLRAAGPPMLRMALPAEAATLALRGSPGRVSAPKALARRLRLLARWIVVGWWFLVLTFAFGPCCEGVAGLLFHSDARQRVAPVDAEGATGSVPPSDDHRRCDGMLAFATALDSRDGGSTLLDGGSPGGAASMSLPGRGFGSRCPPSPARALPRHATRLHLRLCRLLE